MSHQFGELLWQHLIRKRGLSQNKLAMGINQDPAVIARMCNGRSLTGPQSRERIVQIIEWLHDQGALDFVEEANALLAAADKPGLAATTSPAEARLLSILKTQAPVPTPAVFPAQLEEQAQQEQAQRQDQAFPPSPYRGLFAFREEDEPFFCGREAFSERLTNSIEALRKPLVAVLGPSGSGKSSVVFAGLVPYLRRTGHWVITSFRPGDHPFQALAAGLVPILEPDMSETRRLIEINELAEAFAEGKLRLRQVIERALEKNPPATRMLLIADQFEELYTLCPDAGARQAFLDLLLADMPAPKERGNGRAPHPSELSTVITLRADFLGPALAYRPMVDALQGADIKLGSMTRQELQAAVEIPAGKLGVGIEAGLTKRILDAVTEQPGNLPLLEFALTLLWARQSNGMLTHAAYDEIGGVDKALARYAEEIFNELTEDEQHRAKHVFIQLVQPGESTEDTRRLANREEVKEDNWDLVAELASARLVISNRDEASGEDTVEIVHEALISGWDRLREWIESDRQFRIWQERMRGALHQWEGSGRDDGALLRGAPLVEAQQWLTERVDDLSESEQHFIQTSIELREREEATEESRKEHELQLARDAASAQERAARGLRYLALALGIFSLIAVVLSAWAINSSTTAQTNFSDAQAVRLAAKSQLLDQDSPVVAALLAIRSLGIKQADEGEAALDKALLFEYPGKVFQGHDSGVWGIAISNDGTRLLAGSYDETAIMWDVASGKQLLVLTDTASITQRANGESFKVWDVALSPDDRYALTAHTDGRVRLWDISSRPDPNSITEPLVITRPVRVLDTGSNARVISAAFSPDGKYVLAGGEDGVARMWDLSGNLLRTFTQHTDRVSTLAFTPDGKNVLTGSRDNTVLLWQLGDLTQPRELTKPTKKFSFPQPVNSIAVSSDGAKVLVGGDTGMLQLWDIVQSKLLATFTGQVGNIAGVAYWTDPVSHQDYAASSSGDSGDGTVRVWDADRGELRRTLAGIHPWANRIAFSPHGQFIALATEDRTAKLWNIGEQPPLREFVGHQKSLQSAEFSPDGKYVLTTSIDHTARLWDRQTGNPVFTFTGYNDELTLGAFSPDGKYIVTGTRQKDHMARLWDISDKNNIHIAHDFTEHTDQVYTVAFSPDGKYLLTGSDDYTAILWSLDPNNYHLIRRLDQPKHLSWITSVAFMPDGKRALTASADKLVRLWDVNTGQLLHTFDNGIAVLKVDVSPDGKYILAAGYDGVTRLWDAVNWKSDPDREFKGHTDAVSSVVFSPGPNYPYVLTASFDGTARLWDRNTGKQLRILAAGRSPLETAVFSPDEGHKYILTASDDNIARIIFIGGNLQEAVTDLCARLPVKDFSADERVQFGIITSAGSIDNTSTCSK